MPPPASQNAQSSHYPSLETMTFGVEYQFYVHEDVILTPAKDGNPRESGQSLIDKDGAISKSTHTRVGKFLQNMLGQLGLPHQVELTNTWGGNHRRTKNEVQRKSWIIKTYECLVDYTRVNALPNIHMALVTPILNNSKSLHEQVLLVGQNLRDSPYVSFTNKCDLYVDIGNEERITVLSCQKLFSLLFLGGESILDVLFREDRRNNSSYSLLESAAPVLRIRVGYPTYALTGQVPMDWFDSCFSQFTSEIDQDKKNALWRIWRTGTRDEFSSYASGYKSVAIKFHNIQDDGICTIGFAKADGQLDKDSNIEFLSVWLKVCMGLVAFAIDAELPEFGRVMRDLPDALTAPTGAERLQRFLTSLAFDDDVINSLVTRANALSSEPLGDPQRGLIGE